MLYYMSGPTFNAHFTAIRQLVLRGIGSLVCMNIFQSMRVVTVNWFVNTSSVVPLRPPSAGWCHKTNYGFAAD